MDKNTLNHAGIKGMKWGVRRYQNKDGSLTPAGKQRYSSDISGMSEKQKKKYVTDPNKWVKEDISRTKGVTDASVHATNKLNEFNRVTTKPKTRAKMDLSNMTDKEMRDQINRALLEKQYNDMFAPQKTSKGREYVSKTLEVSGAVLGVASSALGIALAIRDFKNKAG